jgi:zinc transport system permease protein
MDTINQLIQLFPYAIAGSILAGMICSFLGVFVISQRVVFLGAVLTQVSIAGVAFSFLHLINFGKMFFLLTGTEVSENSFIHHFEPTFFSLLFAIAAILIFSQTYRQKHLTQDVILGIIFVVAIAARIMFIQKSPVAEVAEIESILKGDILFIGAREFYTLLIILFISVGAFIIFQKQLQLVTFDPDAAGAHGINSRAWVLIFYLVVGTGISLTTRFVGDVFTFAYLIIPSSIGLLLSKKVINVFILSVLIGAIVPPVAIYLAFRLDFPSGPTAVVASFFLFMIVWGYKKIKEG